MLVIIKAIILGIVALVGGIGLLRTKYRLSSIVIIPIGIIIVVTVIIKLCCS
ncbi:hypothetical protein HYI18_16050 [Clostridium botulinum]|uniref:hypothetical protein n=1 Tax=Clostridium botulinum TaxID=1491 RepID=UPI0017491D15|nr:hypothetical protein [Clostridium botulinum]MBD5640078.1 hypothetical protein [Clostridium botulinum]MDI6920000.1 hypothetical protein [Clostridium botulinum]WMU99611.1 hypothetical protein QA656_19975 [Clostridium botulinum]